MGDRFSFQVLGVPAPQGSKTGFVVKSKATGKLRAVVAEGGSATGRRRVAEWRDAVAQAAAQCVADLGMDPLDEAVALDLMFFLPVVASDPYRTRNTKKPDADKLVRSTLDGLVMGGLLKDDARACDGRWAVRYANDRAPGAIIGVTPLGHLEEMDRVALKERARRERASG